MAHRLPAVVTPTAGLHRVRDSDLVKRDPARAAVHDDFPGASPSRAWMKLRSVDDGALKWKLDRRSAVRRCRFGAAGHPWSLRGRLGGSRTAPTHGGSSL